MKTRRNYFTEVLLRKCMELTLIRVQGTKAKNSQKGTISSQKSQPRELSFLTGKNERNIIMG